MKITMEEVDYVALLGRLALEPDEKKKHMGHLDDILRYMEVLDGVETGNVPPSAGPLEQFTPLREDICKPSLPIEEALENAPEVFKDSFRVPKIIE